MTISKWVFMSALALVLPGCVSSGEFYGFDKQGQLVTANWQRRVWWKSSSDPTLDLTTQAGEKLEGIWVQERTYDPKEGKYISSSLATADGTNKENPARQFHCDLKFADPRYDFRGGGTGTCALPDGNLTTFTWAR